MAAQLLIILTNYFDFIDLKNRLCEKIGLRLDDK
jgi:hypothetical protein